MARALRQKQCTTRRCNVLFECIAERRLDTKPFLRWAAMRAGDHGWERARLLGMMERSACSMDEVMMVSACSSCAKMSDLGFLLVAAYLAASMTRGAFRIVLCDHVSDSRDIRSSLC